jgi:hypothetical protein
MVPYGVIGTLYQFNIVLLDGGILARVPIAVRNGDMCCFAGAAHQLYVVRAINYASFQLVGREYTVAEFPSKDGEEISITLVGTTFISPCYL